VKTSNCSYVFSYSDILVQERYEMFKESMTEVKERVKLGDNSRITAQDHPSVIEVLFFIHIMHK
jgi:hypothetical protein